ncbi:amino acid ABC transporter substrate-binding protein, PAAT family [Kushneria avicenniae]|uniref:Amino acid ABC transporter substrate-binding protein, PAAT family n=1 Tax=Kushneria avicenniae TaxID=402385 RepID=A0A1I1IKX2_9GAMM|nr:ABC transporter substrate-binding protein [Kushneria avicenniae]SFC33870.1 amino acid ABC transporter substrate-binding protein, PAAT family [Kushneria avicenniae]
MTLGRTLRMLALAGATAFPLIAQSAQAEPASRTLRAASDVGLAPFAMVNPDGGYRGFSIDLVNELASRLGYDDVNVMDVQFSSIFSGLYADRYDMILAPTDITRERAEKMLFTEGYMSNQLGVLMSAEADVEAPKALEGMTLAVNSGSVAEDWANEHQEQYGFDVQRYDQNTDAVQAVMSGQADANVTDSPAADYVAQQQSRLAVAFDIDTGSRVGLAFSKENRELRDRADHAIEQMKADGTLAGLYENWFGSEPRPGGAMTMISVGRGEPGMPGYELTFDQGRSTP